MSYTTCGATYTTRDGGSTLTCTETAGHPAGGLAGHGHYSEPQAPRMGHCTTLSGHSWACDRDGSYCSRESTHVGPCTPHGTAR